MSNLTTPAKVKVFMQQPGLDDALLTPLIAAASDQIRRMTDRHLTARDYRERIDGNGRPQIGLREWPVASVSRIATGRDDALRVRYTGSGIRAQAVVLVHSLVLKSTDDTGTVTSEALDFDDHKSTQALADEINSAVDDWEAQVVANVPSADLWPTGGLPAKQWATLQYPAHDDFEWRIKPESGVIARPKKHSPFMWTPPVFDESTPRMGFQNVLVEYRAGYETVPPDLEQIANEFVQAMVQAGTQQMGIQSEKLGDYSYTLASDVATQLTTQQRDRIAHWSRIR